MTTTEQIVQDTHPRYPNEFLRIVVGSTLSGLSLAGVGDRDEMGVCIEAPETIVGLKHFEQHVYRTKPEGHKSGPGDLDLTVYGLRKWMRLAVNGNPTVLQLLFAPYEFRVFDTLWAAELRSLAPSIVSRQCARTFGGYLQAQKQRMLGERGGRRVQRPLNDRGYDGKYAAHMTRLGYQGVELLTTGRMTLPMVGEARDYCLAVRRGEVDVNEVLTRVGELEAQLDALRSDSPLPLTPDLDAVNEFLFETYRQHWEMAA